MFVSDCFCFFLSAYVFLSMFMSAVYLTVLVCIELKVKNDDSPKSSIYVFKNIRVNYSIGEPFTETAILFSRDRTLGRATAGSCVWFIIGEPPRTKKRNIRKGGGGSE